MELTTFTTKDMMSTRLADLLECSASCVWFKCVLWLHNDATVSKQWHSSLPSLLRHRQLSQKLRQERLREIWSKRWSTALKMSCSLVVSCNGKVGDTCNTLGCQRWPLGWKAGLCFVFVLSSRVKGKETKVEQPVFSESCKMVDNSSMQRRMVHIEKLTFSRQNAALDRWSPPKPQHTLWWSPPPKSENGFIRQTVRQETL